MTAAHTQIAAATHQSVQRVQQSAEDIGPRGVGVAVSLTLALLFGLLSFWQTAIWSNSLTLFGATLESLEGSVFAGDFTWRLGLIHARAGNDDRAAEYFEWFRKTGLKDSLGHRYAAAFALAHDELPAANQHAAV